jgi:hypothetical protein
MRNTPCDFVGAIEAAVSLMRAHAVDAELQAAGCYALHCTVMWHDRHGVTSAARAVRAGAIPLVQSALRMHGDSPAFSRTREDAEWLQAELQAYDVAAYNAADAAMAALLAEEEAERGAAQQPKKGGAGANKGSKAKQKRKNKTRQTDCAGAAPPPAGAAGAALADDDTEEDAAAAAASATSTAAADEEEADAPAHHATDASDAARVQHAVGAPAPPHEAGAASLADDAIISSARCRTCPHAASAAAAASRAGCGDASHGGAARV